MGIFKKTTNRSVPLSKMKSWTEKQQLSKVVELLEQGDHETKLNAIDFLSTINMVNVKRELITCLANSDKEIALKAASSLEYMGVTPEEREAVNVCKKKWGKPITKPKNKNTGGDDKEIVFSLD